jgi:hypothetical protein
MTVHTCDSLGNLKHTVIIYFSYTVNLYHRGLADRDDFQDIRLGFDQIKFDRSPLTFIRENIPCYPRQGKHASIKRARLEITNPRPGSYLAIHQAPITRNTVIAIKSMKFPIRDEQRGFFRKVRILVIHFIH